MSDITIKVDGKAHELDDFTLGDLEWLEEFLGSTLNDPDSLNSMKAALGFVYLIKRRDDPEFTLDQARALRLAVIEAPDDEDDGAAERPPKRAARK